MPESQYNQLNQLLQFFRNETDRRSQSSGNSYRQAIASLSSFLNTLDNPPQFPSRQSLTGWLVNMYLSGLSMKTATLYFDIISALYGAAVKEDLAEPSNLFREIKAAFKSSDTIAWEKGVNEETFERVLNLTKSASLQKGVISTATDLVLFSLLNGCMPLSKIAGLKVNEIDKFNEESEEIASRQASPRRRYIFDLGQAQRTPRQLEKHINTLILDLFRLRNIPLFSTVSDTLASFWAYAALRSGASASDVVSFLGYPPSGVPVLSLCQPVELSEDKRNTLRNVVASLFMVNPLRWYAMRLRPHVSFEEVTRRFGILSDQLQQPRMFYPLEEIVKRTGKKLKFEKKPVIHDVVFFHSRVTDIFPMFTKIGDLAWCYTVTGKTGTVYAAIPQAAFENFQKTIGHFTPEYEVAPIGTFKPEAGEKIMVVGGLFTGQQADLEKIDQTDNTIYRLQFISDNGIEWRVGVDSRLTKVAR